jgi:hypothetical protein
MSTATETCAHENCEVATSNLHLYCCDCGQDMDEGYMGIRIQVDNESLADVPFDVFEPIFRAELEKAFPDADVTVDCGLGARVDFDGIKEDNETIHECSERAFAEATNKEPKP